MPILCNMFCADFVKKYRKCNAGFVRKLVTNDLKTCAQGTWSHTALLLRAIKTTNIDWPRLKLCLCSIYIYIYIYILFFWSAVVVALVQKWWWPRYGHKSGMAWLFFHTRRCCCNGASQLSCIACTIQTKTAKRRICHRTNRFRLMHANCTDHPWTAPACPWGKHIYLLR